MIIFHMYAYTCLYICEINDRNNTKDRRKELEIFFIIRYSHYPWRYLVLFESELELVNNDIKNSR